MARTSTKFAARMIDAEFQAIKRDRGGEIGDTFVLPRTGEVEQNHVLISVRALKDLEAALRGEDTMRAMKRTFKGGA